MILFLYDLSELTLAAAGTYISSSRLPCRHSGTKKSHRSRVVGQIGVVWNRPRDVPPSKDHRCPAHERLSADGLYLGSHGGSCHHLSSNKPIEKQHDVKIHATAECQHGANRFLLQALCNTVSTSSSFCPSHAHHVLFLLVEFSLHKKKTTMARIQSVFRTFIFPEWVAHARDILNLLAQIQLVQSTAIKIRPIQL